MYSYFLSSHERKSLCKLKKLVGQNVPLYLFPHETFVNWKNVFLSKTEVIDLRHLNILTNWKIHFFSIKKYLTFNLWFSQKKKLVLQGNYQTLQSHFFNIFTKISTNQIYCSSKKLWLAFCMMRKKDIRVHNIDKIPTMYFFTKFDSFWWFDEFYIFRTFVFEHKQIGPRKVFQKKRLNLNPGSSSIFWKTKHISQL